MFVQNLSTYECRSNLSCEKLIKIILSSFHDFPVCHNDNNPTIGHRIAPKKFDTKIFFGQKSNKTIGKNIVLWWPLVTLFKNV